MAERKNTLLRLAWEDYEIAHHAFHSQTHPPVNRICNLAHDAVEKWLKAVIEYHDQRPEETHDLVMLNKTCIRHNSRFTEINHICLDLQRYSVRPRYSDDLNLTDHDAQIALQKAKSAFDFFKELNYPVEISERTLSPEKPQIWTQSRLELLHELYLAGEINIKSASRGLESLQLLPAERKDLLAAWQEERRKIIQNR